MCRSICLSVSTYRRQGGPVDAYMSEGLQTAYDPAYGSKERGRPLYYYAII